MTTRIFLTKEKDKEEKLNSEKEILSFAFEGWEMFLFLEVIVCLHKYIDGEIQKGGEEKVPQRSLLAQWRKTYIDDKGIGYWINYQSKTSTTPEPPCNETIKNNWACESLDFMHMTHIWKSNL